MLFKRPRSIRAVHEEDQLVRIAEAITLEQPFAFPVFECVKVWCRLNESGNVVFAREKNHVLEGGVSVAEVTSKFKNGEIKEEVSDVLQAASQPLVERWPFMEGSNSWIMLEILSPEFAQRSSKNKRTIILRRAARLSYNKGPVSSPMSERVFQRMNKNFSCGGVTFCERQRGFLKSASGDGVLTEVKESIASVGSSEVPEDLIRFLFRQNQSLGSVLGYPADDMTESFGCVTAIDVSIDGDVVRFPKPKNVASPSPKLEESFLISPIWRK